LNPQVYVTNELKDKRAGHPDLDAQAAGNGDIRVAFEVKGADRDVYAVANNPQVSKYLSCYGAVVVTNLHQFLFITCNPDGGDCIVANYTIAASEGDLWVQPVSSIQTTHDQAFDDFLKHILTHNALIPSPDALAENLARYARIALRRLKNQLPNVLEHLPMCWRERWPSSASLSLGWRYSIPTNHSWPTPQCLGSGSTFAT
jgi:hypothetical protein